MTWPVIRAGLWFAAIGAGMGVLHQAQLPATDATSAGFAVIRVTGLIAGFYLLAVSILRVLVTVLQRERLSQVAEYLTVPAIRRVLDAAIGTTAVLAFATGPAGATPTGPATTQASPAETASPETAGPAGGSGEAGQETPPVLRHVDDDGRQSEDSRQEVVAATGQTAATWTVRPGDHFWSIAEAVVTDATGRTPTDAEIARYWHDLIEANLEQLVHPDVPDLIYPGQEFVLPPAP